jgi:hypothetical protein
VIHADYLRELEARLVSALGDSLEGIYLIGSAAFGDYVEGESDLDLAAVCARRPAPDALAAVRATSGHDALPCPARLLELVVYSRESLARRPPEFELNLNSGRAGTRWSTDPATEPPFWFSIDIAIAREVGLALRGAPAEDVFPELPEADLLAAVEASLDWYQAEGDADELELARRRARRFRETGVFGPKRSSAGGSRARER